mmetsp:Transcript_52965/g.133843  ORF Transcript_52965/g.133843 Transcript_52965/m.133843 type:complete len:495 (+) Transcript_52965:240-1724(+)
MAFILSCELLPRVHFAVIRIPSLFFLLDLLLVSPFSLLVILLLFLTRLMFFPVVAAVRFSFLLFLTRLRLVSTNVDDFPGTVLLPSEPLLVPLLIFVRTSPVLVLWLCCISANHLLPVVVRGGVRCTIGLVLLKFRRRRSAQVDNLARPVLLSSQPLLIPFLVLMGMSFLLLWNLLRKHPLFCSVSTRRSAVVPPIILDFLLGEVLLVLDPHPLQCVDLPIIWVNFPLFSIRSNLVASGIFLVGVSLFASLRRARLNRRLGCLAVIRVGAPVALLVAGARGCLSIRLSCSTLKRVGPCVALLDAGTRGRGDNIRTCRRRNCLRAWFPAGCVVLAGGRACSPIRRADPVCCRRSAPSRISGYSSGGRGGWEIFGRWSRRLRGCSCRRPTPAAPAAARAPPTPTRLCPATASPPSAPRAGRCSPSRGDPTSGAAMVLAIVTTTCNAAIEACSVQTCGGGLDMSGVDHRPLSLQTRRRTAPPTRCRAKWLLCRSSSC